MPQNERKYKILILSNEKKITNKLSILFESSKYKFELVRDPLSAINKVIFENFDLIIINFTFSKQLLNILINKIRFFDAFTYIMLIANKTNINTTLDIIQENDIQAYYNLEDHFKNLVMIVSLITNSIYEFDRINMQLGEYGDNFVSPYINTVEILRNIGEYKDISMIGHSFRVSKFSTLIGRKMGLSRNDLKLLKIGSMFHDIGKISIPNNILIKNSRLNDDEYFQVKFHPLIGSHILFPIPFYSKVIPIIKFHHERFDGKGYPFKLKGEKIPLLTRIVTVADTFDAMISKRAYRDALPLDVVIDELEKNKGSQFDPEITDVFLDILKNEYYKIKKIQRSYK